jgi:hypothetical protein
MRLQKWITLFAIAASTFVGANGSAKVGVAPVSITEARSRQFDGPQEGQQRLAGEDLTLLLRLSGDDLESAAEYGMLRIREATDDTGRSLLLKGDDRIIYPEEQAFVPFRIPEFESDPKSAPRQFEVHLLPADRKAVKIATLKGQVQIRIGGEEKFVSAPKAKGLLGKKIEDPILAEAKLEVRLLPVATKPENTFAPDDAEWVDIEVKGNPAAVQKIEMLDSTERDLRVGSAIDDEDAAGEKTEEDLHHHRIAISRALDEKMTLKLTLRIGQKVIVVPIDLKDVKLP